MASPNWSEYSYDPGAEEPEAHEGLEPPEPDWVCHRCQIIVNGGMKAFQKHLKRVDHLPPYICGQGSCIRDYTFRSSLYDHLRKHHMNEPHNVMEPQQFFEANLPQPIVYQPQLQQELPQNVSLVNSSQVAEDCPLYLEDASDLESVSSHNSHNELNPVMNLETEAERSVLRLRSINYMTSVAVQSFQEQSFSLIQNVASQLKHCVINFLISNDYSMENVQNLLNEFHLSDPFKKLKTKKQQLQVFKDKYGLLEAEEISLGIEFLSRQPLGRPVLLPTQVNRSFQYLSIIEILKCVMSDSHLRSLILSSKPSDDGVYRSFCDGSKYKSLPPDLQAAVHIVLFIDDLELLDALSARSGRYIIAGIYFGILNLPAELNALLTFIFVTALAFAEDAKATKVWEPINRDLKILETEGATILVDNEPFVFKAVLVAQIGDCKAAHEVMGFAPASSHSFCRACYIRRPDMWKDGTSVGEPRTPERHIRDVEGCKNTVVKRATGVAGPPMIHGLTGFETVENSVFDLFHDLQEGICKMEIKLALRHYVCIKKYFTEETMRSRLKFFDYGLPDKKNKPSCKITAAYLSKIDNYNLPQTGSQMWCLVRAFPFLFGDLVPADDNFMKLISFLNQIMVILFSRAHTENNLNTMEHLIIDHHKLFKVIFPGTQETTDAAEEDEEQADEPQGGADVAEGGVQAGDGGQAEDAEETISLPEEEFQVFQQPEETDEIITLRMLDDLPDEPAEEVRGRKTKKKKPRVIRMINKHHHMLHYVFYLRMFGCLVLYWCIRYEAKHYFFKLVASVCNNFINILKTLMEMLQMKTCSDRQQPKSMLKMGKQGTKVLSVSDSIYSNELLAFGFPLDAKLYEVKHVTFNGIDIRPELFVTLKLQSEGEHPTFALIKAVFVSLDETAVFVATQKWTTSRFDALYCAFEVEPNSSAPVCVNEVSQLPIPRLLSLWKRYDCDKQYLAPRTIA